ncbi:MAG: hypothetical protein ACJ8BW_01920 [Ktedonobacteraceae bacterium]
MTSEVEVEGKRIIREQAAIGVRLEAGLIRLENRVKDVEIWVKLHKLVKRGVEHTFYPVPSYPTSRFFTST